MFWWCVSSQAGVAHHGIANPLDAVPVQTPASLACFGVGGYACGLFTVGSLVLQRCCWCTVVLAASQAAC